MTQMPPPPPSWQSYGQDQSFVPDAQKRWSGTAIAAFVLAVLGCLGITAPIALVLGVFGIVATKGGKRRGMGLAIASIPIALVTGAAAVVIGLSLIVFGRFVATSVSFAEALQGDEASIVRFYDLAQEQMSDDFREKVSSERLGVWFKAVQAKHGKFQNMVGDPVPAASKSSERGTIIPIDMKAQFASGTVAFRIIILQKGWLDLGLDDIEIDGSSPRDDSPPQPAD
ncbi:MAG: DUF4190 domain-containing protein [Planctomycetota bacterium]